MLRLDMKLRMQRQKKLKVETEVTEEGAERINLFELCGSESVKKLENMLQLAAKLHLMRFAPRP